MNEKKWIWNYEEKMVKKLCEQLNKSEMIG